MAGKQPSAEERIARVGIEMSEEEILRRLKNRADNYWRMIWVLISGLFLVVGTTAIAAVSGHAALVTGMWGRIVTIAVIGALFVYAFVTVIKYSMRPIKADSPRLVHYRMESNLRTGRWSMLFTVFVLFFAFVGLSRALPFLRAAPQVLAMSVAFFAGIMILFAVGLSVGELGAHERLNDEFDSALRARTTRFGYILLMLLLGAVLLVALWWPGLTLTALGWALYAGFAVPALYYLIADWRASRGDEGRDG